MSGMGDSLPVSYRTPKLSTIDNVCTKVSYRISFSSSQFLTDRNSYILPHSVGYRVAEQLEFNRFLKLSSQFSSSSQAQKKT